ncbi:hypothetical protein AVEN_205453-1 [Araneus ventricosus]|uniref:Uncharacterized protein n=1 Tax=Araneus ventricosus TaxID=182803 RepID=A0A4Y2CD35_ARAVE|nr:hypothetical protein AVEN_205453-1 [Araneus ventricosus]
MPCAHTGVGSRDRVPLIPKLRSSHQATTNYDGTIEMFCVQHITSLSVCLAHYRLTSRRGCGGLVVRSRARGRKVPGSPIPLKIRRIWGLLHAKSYAAAIRLPAGAVRKVGEGVSPQMSSSDRVSKLRDPSPNSPCVAS